MHAANATMSPIDRLSSGREIIGAAGTPAVSAFARTAQKTAERLAGGGQIYKMSSKFDLSGNVVENNTNFCG